jgi:uncharacterized membrane protein YcaP (DUF421 family)
MEWLKTLLGEGTQLTIMQMVVRGILVFFAALLMLRIAGKRTFGKQSAADNVIMIILGALLSRAIVGASPILPVLASSFTIVLIHRLLAWFCLRDKLAGKLIKGRELSLYKNGKKQQQNMDSALISEDDLLEGLRLEANTGELADVEEIFIERNGRISVTKK